VRGAALLRRACIAGLAAGAVAAAGSPAPASDGLSLTAAQRDAFGREVRALLLDEPALVADALTPPAPPTSGAIYADAAGRDLDLIAGAAEALFTPSAFGFGAARPEVTLALFVAPDCADCARALAGLTAAAASRPWLRVEIHAADAGAGNHLDLARQGPAALADALPRPMRFLAPPPEEASARAETGARLSARLELDRPPAIVLPRMMLRGWIPEAVLTRYLDTAREETR